MSTHDFKRLSPYDFEELVGDLLGKEWGARLERFAPGKDQGIDLRLWSSPILQIVVQCKHRPELKFAELLSTLRREELPKVVILNPHRYVLVTSARLSPRNKSQLRELFGHFVQSDNDIIGRDDLNALLRNHPEVETSNFKLWFTSTAVMRRVLHNAEAAQTQFEVERVTAALPKFVQSDALPRAQKILSDTRVVIISGSPGIGKTTLADMILYSHIEQGYDPIVVLGDIDEGKALFDKNRKQIFYFDDFLGETFLSDTAGSIDRNQDASLLKFMDAVRATKSSRFVLTTREHILQKALLVSEKFANSEIYVHKCTLDIGDYTRVQKARILYNHLYFSDLPPNYLQEILKEDRFLKIIGHDNFRPRLISWLSSFTRVRDVPPAGYAQFIDDLLDSPFAIWQHAFDRQISSASRTLLLVLASLGHSSDIQDLRPSFEVQHLYSSGKYNVLIRQNDFRNALKELEGTFIRINDGTVGFLNPSVRDFLNKMFVDVPNYASDVLAACIKFKQLTFLRQLAMETQSGELLQLTSEGNIDFMSSARRTLQVPHIRWERTKSGLSGIHMDSGPTARLAWLISLANERRAIELLGIVVEANEALMASWKVAGYDVTGLVQVLKALEASPWVSGELRFDLRRQLLDAVLENTSYISHWEWNTLLEYQSNSSDWSAEDERLLMEGLSDYAKSGVFDEISESETTELRELLEGLEQLEKDYGIGFDSAIVHLKTELSEQSYEPEFDHSDYVPRGTVLSHGTAPRFSGVMPSQDDSIRDMFSSLKGK